MFSDNIINSSLIIRDLRNVAERMGPWNSAASVARSPISAIGYSIETDRGRNVAAGREIIKYPPEETKPGRPGAPFVRLSRSPGWCDRPWFREHLLTSNGTNNFYISKNELSVAIFSSLTFFQI